MSLKYNCSPARQRGDKLSSSILSIKTPLLVNLFAVVLPSRGSKVMVVYNQHAYLAFYQHPYLHGSHWRSGTGPDRTTCSASLLSMIHLHSQNLFVDKKQPGACLCLPHHYCLRWMRRYRTKLLQDICQSFVKLLLEFEWVYYKIIVVRVTIAVLIPFAGNIRLRLIPRQVSGCIAIYEATPLGGVPKGTLQQGCRRACR